MNSIAKPRVMGTMIASSRTLMSTLIYNRKKKQEKSTGKTIQKRKGSKDIRSFCQKR